MEKTSPTSTNVYILTSGFSFSFRPQTPSTRTWKIMETRSDKYSVKQLENDSKTLEIFSVVKLNDIWRVFEGEEVKSTDKKITDRFNRYSWSVKQIAFGKGCVALSVLTSALSLALLVSKAMGWISRGYVILYSISLIASIRFGHISYTFLTRSHFDLARIVLFIANKPTDSEITVEGLLNNTDYGFPNEPYGGIC